MKVLRYASALLIIVHTVSAQEVVPPVVKSYRQELADPDRLATELLRIRRDRNAAKLETDLEEAGLEAGRSPEELKATIESTLADLQKKAEVAAEKRENLTATKDDSRVEAAQWLTISRLLEFLGNHSAAHDARMNRLAALTQFASAEDWLEGALDVTVSFRKISARAKSDEWMERCRNLVETDATFRGSERAKARIAFQEAVDSNEFERRAKASAAVTKAFGPNDPFSMVACEAAVFGSSSLAWSQGHADEWRRLLQMRETVFGPTHPATLRFVAKLGYNLRYYGGDKDEGMRMQKRAVDGWLANGGLGSTSRLSVAETIARQSRLDGDNVYADKLLRMLIPISEKLRGPENRETLWLRSDLAIVIGNTGNFAEAEKMNRDLLEIRKRALGPDHSDTITSINNTAVQLSHQGKYREALAMYEEAYALRLKTGKEDDPEALRTRSNIAVQLISLGHFEEAAPIVNAVLELRTQKLGATNRDTIYSKGQLSGLHSSKGDLTAAEKFGREYVDETIKLLGGEHPSARSARSQLAAILLEKGEFAAALDTARELAEWHEKHPGADRTGKNDSDMLLGEALLKSGDHEKARPLLVEAVRAQETLSGPTHLDTLRGKLLIALLHIRSSEPQAAAPILRSVINTVTEKIDTEHPLVAEAAIELADLLEKNGEIAEAADLKKRAREIATKKLHTDSPLRKRCEK